MLTVHLFCSLIIATVTGGPTKCTPDKERKDYSLVPSLLRLERTVTLLSSKLESTTALLSKKLKKNTAAISSINSELRDKDAQLLGFTRSLAQLKTDVAFEASLPSDRDDVNDNVHFKFSNVPYNRGGGYRKSSGIFTAPMTGTYMFWAHIMNLDSTTSLFVYMYKDGVELARGYTHIRRLGGVASISTVTSLKKGDQVWLLKHGSSRIRGEHWSSYGGVLLRAH